MRDQEKIKLAIEEIRVKHEVLVNRDVPMTSYEQMRKIVYEQQMNTLNWVIGETGATYEF